MLIAIVSRSHGLGITGIASSRGLIWSGDSGLVWSGLVWESLNGAELATHVALAGRESANSDAQP